MFVFAKNSSWSIVIFLLLFYTSIYLSLTENFGFAHYIIGPFGLLELLEDIFPPGSPGY
jgi:hypothetical protein